MILALVSPHELLSIRGSSITVQGIGSGLNDHGLTDQVSPPGKKGEPA